MDNNNNNNQRKLSQCAKWMWTLFIDDESVAEIRIDNDVDLLFNGSLPMGAKYAIYQMELCPKTGRYHFQGYLVLGRSQRFNWVKDWFAKALGTDKVHLEGALGTHEECKRYCSKSETRALGPWELGDDKGCGQGKRSDLVSVQELIDAGATMDEIRRTHFASWVRYRQAFTEYMAAERADRDIKKYQPEHFRVPLLSFEETKAWLVYGPTNTGKTNYALAHFKKPLLVRDLEDLRSLGPEHDGLVFDDIDFKHLFFTPIKNILDPDFPGIVRVRYQNVTIPQGMPRIFTHQHSDIFYPASLSIQQIAAVDRLFQKKEVTQDLRLLVLAYDSQDEQ